MKYGVFDVNGLPIAFYDDNIHRKEDIPKNAIALTDVQWLEFINNQGHRQWNFETNEIEYCNRDDFMTLAEAKDRKLKEIKGWFEYAISSYMFSPTFQVNVDIGDEHLRNVEKLIDYMEGIGMKKVMFRVYDNSFVEATLDDLKKLKVEMIEHGLQAYHKKWNLEAALEAATTIEEVNAIQW